jgi:hypothetical protein
MVQDYTKRELTDRCDRMIALEGVKKLMSYYLSDVCVLGIWRADAHRSLLCGGMTDFKSTALSVRSYIQAWMLRDGLG